MKRIFAVLVLLLILTGCQNSDGTEPAMTLRDALLQAEGCSFLAVVTADYGDSNYTFTMDCSGDALGNVRFTVAEPETIQGITGVIDHEGGKLTFDDQVLAFPLLADEQLTPVSAPWLLVRTLRGGYISAGGQDGEYYKVQMDDSYEEDPLRMDVWLDDRNMPVHCDFLWANRRILSVEIRNFQIL